MKIRPSDLWSPWYELWLEPHPAADYIKIWEGGNRNEMFEAKREARDKYNGKPIISTVQRRKHVWSGP